MTGINVPKCLSKISPRWAKLLELYSIPEIINGCFVEDKHFDLGDEEYEANDLATQMETDVLNINQFDCCIVGEAYGCHDLKSCEGDFDEPEYHCRTCKRFSMDFLGYLEDMYHAESCHCDEDDECSSYTEEDYEGLIEQFCEHIGSVHPQLIKSEEACN